MVNGSVISDIVNNPSKQTPESRDRANQASTLSNTSPLKKEDLGSNLFSIVVISLIVLVALIGIIVISYFKTK